MHDQREHPKPGALRSLWQSLLGPAQGSGQYELHLRHGLGLAAFAAVFAAEGTARYYFGSKGFHLWAQPLVHGGLAWVAAAVTVRKRPG